MSIFPPLFQQITVRDLLIFNLYIFTGPCWTYSTVLHMYNTPWWGVVESEHVLFSSYPMPVFSPPQALFSSVCVLKRIFHFSPYHNTQLLTPVSLCLAHGSRSLQSGGIGEAAVHGFSKSSCSRCETDSPYLMLMQRLSRSSCGLCIILGARCLSPLRIHHLTSGNCHFFISELLSVHTAPSCFTDLSLPLKKRSFKQLSPSLPH